MKKGTVVMIGLLVWAGVITAQTPKYSPRSTLIDQMHAYYVKQFEDLAMTKVGQFGLSRVESSEIKNHLKNGMAPGFKNADWKNRVEAWGDHGKPLTADKVTERYSRNWSWPPRGVTPVTTDDKAIGKVKSALIKTTVKEWGVGKVANKGATVGNAYIEVRPVKLTKLECLSCHKGMTLNQPVAAMVYIVARYK